MQVHRPIRHHDSISADRGSMLALAGDFFILFFGITCSFSVHLVGQLPIAEILAIPTLPFLLLTRTKEIFRPGLRTVYVLLLLWLIGQVVTDAVRRTATVDWMGADAAILFFGMDIMLLAALISNSDRRKVLFFLGFGVGVILGTRFEPTGWAPDYPWKFGYGPGVILLVVLLSCFFYKRRVYPVVILLYVGLILVNLLANYRSPILFLIVSAILVIPVIPERIGRLQLLPRNGRAARVALLSVLGLAGGWAAQAAVSWATNRGLAGEEARQKNLGQMESKGGLLLGGRPEIFISVIAVKDSPLIGHGAHAKDYKYRDILADINEERNLPDDPEFDEELFQGVIPTHSHLIGGWVAAGILGSLVWFYLFWIALKGLVETVAQRPPLAPLYSYLLIMLVFDTWFSPFGSTERAREAGLIIIMFDLLAQGAVQLKPMERFRRLRWQRRRFASLPVQ